MIMTAQEIAKALYNIDFVSVQCDCPQENEKVKILLKEIEENFSFRDGLRLMRDVLEVKDISKRTDFSDWENPFLEMAEFNYAINYSTISKIKGGEKI